MLKSVSLALAVVIAFGLIVAAMPRPTAAIMASCPMTYPPGSKKKPWDYTIDCTVTVSGGNTSGKCVTGKCLGQTSQGLGGLQEALGMAKQILDILKGQGGGGGGGGGSTLPDGCLTGYYNTTSSTSTDPCAIYTQPTVSTVLTGSGSTTNSSSISNALLNALGGGTTNTNTNTNNNTTVNTNTNANTQANTNSNIVTPTTTKQLGGSIKVGEAGATIVSNLRDGLSEVAGFFGGSTFGTAGTQSVAGRLCATRPWAQSGVVAKIIPDSFFDSLCSKGGYQVGVTVPNTSTPSTVVAPKTTTTPTKPTATTTTQKPVNTIPLELNVWAEPASVRLGTRTYIFWTSRGATSCVVIGPNFTQVSLSGGASTVPLSGATTYTLECTAPDGTKKTDTVTVNLAI